ncbi:MAG: hypothetical protein LC099_07630 [Anaerolineales bacterium]|nr:hypothetical protein [Anaerolineales bacterium]
MKRLAYLYLILPFFIFLFGWVRLRVSLPLSLIFFFALYKLSTFNLQPSTLNLKLSTFNLKHLSSALRPSSFVLLTWLLLSGIGGYAFQNWDHNWRNAVFRDLIAFQWPVYYAQPASGAVKALVYYFGFWLPAALVGKLTNAQIANLALFLWTWLGLILTVRLTSEHLKTSALKVALLLIFFSGADIVGALLFPQNYPTVLPPITHLEAWANGLQYSSFTTQLFWVYNQAVPAWLCVILIATLSREAKNNQKDRRAPMILLWTLCFFFAPLASIGLLPYLFLELIRQTDFKTPFKNLRWEILLPAIVIFSLSYFFFSANAAAQSRGFQSLPPLKFLAFFLLEGGALWLILAPFKFRDARWILTGILLAAIPFIQLGSGRDFVMRASIAPLFYLMLLTGEALFNSSAPRRMRIAIFCLLIFGAFTPLYEINRSVYRTYQYYFVLDDSQKMSAPPAEALTHLPPPGALENEHPNTLTADAIPTLKYMTDQLSQNFIADVRSTFFYQYLMRR